MTWHRLGHARVPLCSAARRRLTPRAATRHPGKGLWTCGAAPASPWTAAWTANYAAHAAAHRLASRARPHRVHRPGRYFFNNRGSERRRQQTATL